MKSIRTFIAIDISPELREILSAMIRHVAGYGKQVNWEKAQSVHITLKFLGEITPDEVEKVFLACKRASADTGQFHLTSGEKGAFPNLRQPRVFWIGLTPETTPPLLTLQKKVEEELVEQGFPPDKRSFKPHLTLGRVKQQNDLDKITGAFLDYPTPSISFQVSELLVMKSELTRQGAVYTIQNSYPF